MSNNYPLGAAEDSSAPFNEVEEKENIEQIQVVCVNTLSKDFAIDVSVDKETGFIKDNVNLTEEFKQQDFSAKEALDLAVKYSKEACNLAKLLQKKYPNIAEKLRQQANILWATCDYWNEDEIEVVQV